MPARLMIGAGGVSMYPSIGGVSAVVSSTTNIIHPAGLVNGIVVVSEFNPSKHTVQQKEKEKKLVAALTSLSMEEQEESSFPQHSHSPTSATSGAEQPTSNLKRFHGATGLLEFVQRRRSSHDNHEEPYLEADDARFFDSRDYRCCCSIFHAKIGTFVFCTWIFHEIVLGTIYLLTQLENGGELTSRMALLLVCRFIQLPAIALLYVGCGGINATYFCLLLLFRSPWAPL
uniref:Uncharacterized protein n=1 Tax=Ditylenchus dipsaci TaxID=166011 RepID=A0A915DAZ4_9BILA